MSGCDGLPCMMQAFRASLLAAEEQVSDLRAENAALRSELAALRPSARLVALANGRALPATDAECEAVSGSPEAAPRGLYARVNYAVSRWLSLRTGIRFPDD